MASRCLSRSTRLCLSAPGLLVVTRRQIPLCLVLPRLKYTRCQTYSQLQPSLDIDAPDGGRHSVEGYEGEGDLVDGSRKTVELRPYQESCVEECLLAVSNGVTRIGVSSPTGSGKTTMFASLIDRLPPRNERAIQVLVLVGSIELARQASAQILRICPDKSVEIEQGARNVASGFADVTVATYQTLTRSDRLGKFHPDRFKAVVVDEAHHAAAPSYLKVLAHFDPAIGPSETTEDDVEASEAADRTRTSVKVPASSLKGSQPNSVARLQPLDTSWDELAGGSETRASSNIPIIGFSATFSRHDGLRLGRVFERIVFHRDFLEMIKEKWLCDIRFTTVKADIDLSRVVVSSASGDYTASSLASVVDTPSVNRLVVKSYLDKAKTTNSRLMYSTHKFAVNVPHIFALANEFRTAGIDARCVYAGTPYAERVELLEAFRRGEFPVLVNCAILTEGADVPNIDCVLLARPTRSRNLFSQMIGRGLRLSPQTGKTACLILDMVGNFERGLVCTPTLFGLDPHMMVEGVSTADLEKLAASLVDTRAPEAKSMSRLNGEISPESVTYIDYDNPLELIEDSVGKTYIGQISRNAWVPCGKGTFVLELMGFGYIKVNLINGDEEEGYEAFYTPAARRRAGGIPYLKSRRILDAVDLTGAIQGADTFAKTIPALRGDLQLKLLRGAAWRKAPATDSQKDFLKKRLAGGTDPSPLLEDEPSPSSSLNREESNFIRVGPLGKEIDLGSLTKGKAGDLITRLRHGLKGEWTKKRKAIDKVVKAETKEMAREALRRQKETVQVGPLA